VALRLIDTGGTLSLEPGWVSASLSSPATPLIVNGVVFTLATGMPSMPTGQGTAAVLHAYDGATGRRLWDSGNAMSAFASPNSFWSGLGQIYVGTHDGTLYAFGFDDERRPTNGR
jgi:outer membrane protein assembly factor BamB